MHDEYGYAEDEKLGSPYDVKLLKRLAPFAAPFRKLFFYSIFLVMLITALDLSFPYIVKIAIDRHIVPREQFQPTSEPKAGGDQWLEIHITGPKIEAVIRKHEHWFLRQNQTAMIRYADYVKLSKEELEIIQAQNLSGLMQISALFLMLISLHFGLNFLQNIVMEITGQKMMHDLRLRLYDHIQHLSVSYFSKNPTGRLVTRVTNDVQNMHDLFTSVVTFLFKDVFLLLGISIVLLAMNRRLALVSFAVLPFVVYTSLMFSRLAREAFRELRVKIAEINTRFSETILGINVIQLFSQQARNYGGFMHLNHAYYLAGMRQVRVFALFMPVVELLGMVVLAIVILYGGSGVLRGRISLGELVAFITYMKMFFRPIRDIAEKYNIMQNAMASSERIFLVLDTVDRDGRLPGPKRGRSTAPSGIEKIEHITFDRVWFGYTDNEPVLKNISFQLNRGKSLAVIGPTGSGKTTMINLLLRFYEPHTGMILINGSPIDAFDLSTLRAKIALVMQDPFLFSNTIFNNIAYGNPDIPPDRLKQIVSASHLSALIRELPNGLETVLNEGGRGLSSGERQLISIARAFAGDPELIIFDEATSYVDSETEIKIQDALRQLMRGRTSIMVAHRLSTAKNADSIIVLNDGEIIETGTHDELMKKEGFYFRLHQLQTG
ncbi:MAG: ABC transporter ATP-binding protein [Desulfobacterales bacterium]